MPRGPGVCVGEGGLAEGVGEGRIGAEGYEEAGHGPGVYVDRADAVGQEGTLCTAIQACECCRPPLAFTQGLMQSLLE